MKLLYITSQINGDGGVQRIISIKTDYFIKNFGYKIDILSVNVGHSLFFDFNKNIDFHFIELKSGKSSRFLEYRKQVQKHIDYLKPDCIIVCDFGLKGFAIPLMIKTKIPIVFEAHGSKFNESNYFKKNLFSKISHNLKYKYKDFCANKFDFFVALSKESLNEWSVKNGIVIPNSLNTVNNISSNLNSKKAITIARHSYEKGLDRLLKIWKLVVEKHPDWQLEIYGSKTKDLGLEQLVNHLEIAMNVSFFEPVKNIQQKYQEASVCLMSSRSEGFPMVILEAMSAGLPVIAFDCPIGPRVLIENNYNGFLIPNDDFETFSNKIIGLIENKNVAIKMGENAKLSIQKYDIDLVMKKWNELFLSIKNKT